MAKDHGCAAGSLPGWTATRSKLASSRTPACFWSGKLHTRRSGLRLVGEELRIASMTPSTASTAALSLSPVSRAPTAHCDASPSAQAGWADWTGTRTCRSPVRGSASTNAMSSLDRFPQAVSRRSPARTLETERIIDPQGELGVAEGLVLVHVVEEVVGAGACHRGPARGEAPAERELRARRDGEEVLRGQVAAPAEAAEQVQEGQARSQRDGELLGQVEVAPEGNSTGQLAEAHRDVGHAGEAQGGGAAAHRHVEAPGELVAEVVAGRHLGAGEHRRREQPVARRRVEEELVTAAAQHAPARARGALLRVVLELAAREL